MKSFKVLALLILAATLSCGSPTNVTQATDGSTDSFIKLQAFIKRNTPAKNLVTVDYLYPILKAARDPAHDNAAFTQNVVAGLWDNNKNFNYVVSLTSSLSIGAFLGKEGAEWAQAWIIGLYDAKYHLYVGGAGTFTRNGKGGYQYWAWKGSVTKGQDLHSNVVTFVKPGGMDNDIGSGGD